MVLDKGLSLLNKINFHNRNKKICILEISSMLFIIIYDKYFISDLKSKFF